MCTLVVAHRVVPDTDWIVLANRDEFLDRPSSPPALIRTHPSAYGGRDEQQGGSWLGINQHGLLVGLTNLAGGFIDRSRRSRGLLVVELLGLRSAHEVRDALESLGPDRYNGFNVLAADASDLVRAQYDGRASAELLGPGVHAVTNWREGSEGADKRVAAEARVAQAIREAPTHQHLLEALQAIAASHERGGDPRYSLCCHAGVYGTRCSTIVSAHGQHLQFLHSEGAPCGHRFEDHSSRVMNLMRPEQP